MGAREIQGRKGEKMLNPIYLFLLLFLLVRMTLLQGGGWKGAERRRAYWVYSPT